MNIKQTIPLQKHIDHKIPTRYDDIKNEIFLSKIKGYLAQQEEKPVTYYSLGSVIGNKLDHIL